MVDVEDGEVVGGGADMVVRGLDGSCSHMAKRRIKRVIMR